MSWIHCNQCKRYDCVQNVGECGCILCQQCLTNRSVCPKCGPSQFIQITEKVICLTQMPPEVQRVLNPIESSLENANRILKFQFGNALDLIAHLKSRIAHYESIVNQNTQDTRLWSAKSLKRTITPKKVIDLDMTPSIPASIVTSHSSRNNSLNYAFTPSNPRAFRPIPSSGSRISKPTSIAPLNHQNIRLARSLSSRQTPQTSNKRFFA